MKKPNVKPPEPTELEKAQAVVMQDFRRRQDACAKELGAVYRKYGFAPQYQVVLNFIPTQGE